MNRESPHTGPDFSFEREADALRLRVCGIDEAGRGPLAGPVVAAAVILDPARLPPGLNDSKKLSEKKREALFDLIMAQAEVGIGMASVAEIDAINILQASLLAMARAAAALPRPAQFALIDGNKLPKLDCSGLDRRQGDARRDDG